MFYPHSDNLGRFLYPYLANFDPESKTVQLFNRNYEPLDVEMKLRRWPGIKRIKSFAWERDGRNGYQYGYKTRSGVLVHTAFLYNDGWFETEERWRDYINRLDRICSLRVDLLSVNGDQVTPRKVFEGGCAATGQQEA